MNRSKLIAILVLAACSGSHPPVRPSTPPTPGASRGTAVAMPASTSPYLTPGGTVNEAALRSHFGAPGTNLILNPRATLVETTPSAGDVIVEPNALIFPAGTGSWVLSKAAGDTLYCGTCTKGAFMRNIVEIVPRGDGYIVVETKNATITDIIHKGWLSARVPVHITSSIIPSLTAPGPGPGGVPVIQRDNMGTGPASNKGDNKCDFKSPAAMATGTDPIPVDVTAEFNVDFDTDFEGEFDIDIAIDGSVWNGISVEMAQFEVKSTLTLTTSVDFGVEGSVNVGQLECLGKIPIKWLPKIPLATGVWIDMSETEWHPIVGELAVGGEFKFKDSATLTVGIDTGFIYTKDNPVTTIFNPTSTFTINEPDVEGKVTATVGILTEFECPVLIDGVAGPKLTIGAGPELEGSYDASKNVLQAEIKAKVEPSIAAEFEVPAVLGDWKLEVGTPLATWESAGYPDPPWSFMLGSASSTGTCSADTDCSGKMPKCCNGTCTDAASDTANCGGCGMACPSGQMCQCTDSSCQAASCAPNVSAGGCAQDTDCGASNMWCNSGTCATGCSTDAECSSWNAVGWTCQSNMCAACSMDSQCPSGDFCNTSASPATCQAGCSTDSECASGTTCQSNVCACSTGSCGAGKYCAMNQSPASCQPGCEDNSGCTAAGQTCQSNQCACDDSTCSSYMSGYVCNGGMCGPPPCSASTCTTAGFACQSDGSCACDATACASAVSNGMCQSGMCMSAGCTEGACGAGMYCNMGASPPACATGCENNSGCTETGQACQSNQCACDSSTCASAVTNGQCMSNGACSPAGCTTGACGAGMYCAMNQSPPACETGCEDNSGCTGTGQTCQSNQCACDATTCASAVANGSCEGGTCMAAGCTTGSCGSGMYCDTTQSPPACASGCEQDSDCNGGSCVNHQCM